MTSWTELSRDAEAIERARLLDPGADAGTPYITQALADAPGPVIATSDWQRAVQNLIAPWVPGDYVALGADGFGFSDTRAAARRHFLIDGPSMVVATLAALERRGEYRAGAAAEAAAKYELHDVRAGTSGNAGGDPEPAVRSAAADHHRWRWPRRAAPPGRCRRIPSPARRRDNRCRQPTDRRACPDVRRSNASADEPFRPARSAGDRIG